MSEKLSSNLDTLETSEHTRPPESYRKFCISHCPDEYQATRDAYEFYDEETNGRHVKSFDECRTGAWFARNIKTGKVKILSSSCKLRWCPMCSATRRWFLTQQVSEWLKTAKQPKFLTLTIKHSTNLLDEQIQKLYNCFRSYRRLNLIKRSVKGGVWFFQIHKSKNDGLWHPHLHCVIDSEWMDKYKLSAAWEVVTKDSNIINIKEVKDTETMAEYVARYSARPSVLKTLPIPDRLELMSCLHGRRLVGTWGTARAISLRPSKPPDSKDWKHIGYYRNIIGLLGADDRADTIWHAFKTDSVCPEDCNIQDIEGFTNEVHVYDHKTTEDNKQMFLNFY